MRAFLPQEMNKALRDQLEAALEECGDAPPPTKPGPASTSQPKAKQATSKHRDPPREDPGRTPAPSAAPRPPPAAEEPSIDDGVGMEEDPQVYEEELAMREEELGPEHPDVAESLSNLAILYNQKGEYDKAQPLYERALAIFERTQGKHSSDVAHTLTDLAVLHLEQGRDSEGRPLLERALAIQRANLGDDHPDVIAILEVLESDD